MKQETNGGIEIMQQLFLLNQPEKQEQKHYIHKRVKAVISLILKFLEYHNWISIINQANKKWTGLMKKTELHLLNTVAFIAVGK